MRKDWIIGSSIALGFICLASIGEALHIEWMQLVVALILAPGGLLVMLTRLKPADGLLFALCYFAGNLLFYGVVVFCAFWMWRLMRTRRDSRG